MALAGRDLAILSARFGVARFGASRFAFCPDDVEGITNDEPGEYIWKEDKPPTTTWTLQTHNCYCGTPPVASFTMDTDTGEAPLTVTFTDTSTGSPTLWYWEFGDGTTSQLQNPTHEYALAGTYTVSLWVSGAGGADGPAEDLVTVTIPPGSISGVVSEGGIPYEGAVITLMPGGATTTSGAETGVYSFAGVPPGDVTVTAVAPGLTGTNNGTVVSGEDLVLDIALVGA